uniref:PKD domain-containing protein n=1 Tax=uncultured Maribacter sp. TaxID=431308 RepID=UPI00262E66E6
GTATISVTTQDGNHIATSIITVQAAANQAPNAVATSNVTSGTASLAVDFTGNTSTDPDVGDILSYSWNFGDGGTSTQANPSHTFTTSGTYNVVLTVTDNGSPNLNDTANITITVSAA